jgi:phospholipase/carboxylesterase
MKAEMKRYGSLDCVVVDALPADCTPQSLVVLCHGYGAGGQDLVPLAPEILELAPRLAESVRFMFPAAPLEPEELRMYGGRAWWPIDIALLTEAIERDLLRTATPAELPGVREQMLALIDAAARDAGLDASRVVLGGFSQGAMVALDAALHLPEAPLGVLIYSGTLLCESEWKSLAAKRPGLNVLQSHGKQDPLLPFGAAQNLFAMLKAAGANIEFLPFRGPHTIPLEALERTATSLESWRNL